MKLRTATAMLFIALLLMAVSFGGNRVVPNVVNPTTTTQDMVVYVADGGLDSNDCLSASTACLTPQVAESKLPKIVKHGEKISIGCGTFPGLVVSGHTVMAPDAYGTNYAYHHIQGTMQNVTAAGGSNATGTLTSWSAASGATFSVASDSSKNFTVDEFKGKYLLAVSGTGSTATAATPATALIASNTSTSFTLVSSLTMAAGTVYQVIVPCTVINSGTTPATSAGIPSGVANVLGPSGLAYPNNVGFNYIVENVEFDIGTATTITRAIIVYENRLRIVNSRFIGTTGASTGIIQGTPQVPAGGVTLFGVYGNFPSGVGAFITFGSSGGSTPPGGVGISASMFENGQQGLQLSASPDGPVITSSYFKGQSFTSLQFSNSGLSQVLNTRINGSATGISCAGTSSTGMGSCNFAINNVDISSCTVSGITLSGGLAAGFIGATSGSANLVGITLVAGSKANIASNTSITGTSSEILIDGVASTLATMRAATPKYVGGKDNVYGTIFYQ